MESEQAILAFAALAQPTRLNVFRLLMEHEPDGLPAGEIARRMEANDWRQVQEKPRPLRTGYKLRQRMEAA